MDAFDIALLMANQHADGPMRMRYGTVVGACDESVLSVVPDGQESPVPAVKCCLPAEGSRVVLLVNGTEWLAVSVVGGDCPYGVGDVLTTFSSDDPHERWRGTTWEQLHDRMLLASGKRGAGEAGGEEEHTLTKAEMPGHAHALIGYWRVPNSGEYQVASYRSIGSDPPTTEEDSSVRYNGGSQPHNNMPPYLVAHMWKRIA